MDGAYAVIVGILIIVLSYCFAAAKVRHETVQQIIALDKCYSERDLNNMHGSSQDESED